MGSPAADDRTQRPGCLSPATVMAFVDGGLSDCERVAAEAHLELCSRCRQSARDLSAAAHAAEIHLNCLDDEGVAAYTEYRMGVRRPALSRDDVERMRRHVTGCARCREQVDLLTRAYGGRFGAFRFLLGALATSVLHRPAFTTPVLRWAPAAAMAAVAIVALYVVTSGLLPRQASTPTAPRIAATPVPPASGSRGAREVARIPQLPPGSGTQEMRPGIAPKTTAPGGGRAPSGGRGPREVPPTDTALLSPPQTSQGTIAQAQAELDRAVKRGDAREQALAETKLAGVYHGERDYTNAVPHYRRAAAAAEKAGESELRIDSLIMLGAVLAEIGQGAEAQRQLELARDLARQTAYSRGEENALMQLQLLEAQQAGGEE